MDVRNRQERLQQRNAALSHLAAEIDECILAEKEAERSCKAVAEEFKALCQHHESPDPDRQSSAIYHERMMSQAQVCAETADTCYKALLKTASKKAELEKELRSLTLCLDLVLAEDLMNVLRSLCVGLSNNLEKFN